MRLRNSVRYCEFTGAILNENLVEQLISGIDQSGIERKLLQKGTSLTLADAVQQASAFLLLDTKRGSQDSDTPPLDWTSGISNVSEILCYRCGRS